MTTQIAGYQIIWGTGAPVALAPNNVWYIDTSTNALYISQTGVWLQISGGGGGAIGANPTATASNVAVNGVAATFMRSDAAPAIQLATNSVFGLMKPDGVTITIAAGVISAVASPVTLTAGSTATSGFAVGDLIVNDTGNHINPVADVAVHQVLISGGVGAKPSYSATPVLTSVTFGSGTALNDYEEGTWTPVDISGGGLTFTLNHCTYTKIGRWVNIVVWFKYPSNADPSSGNVNGLPFATPSNVQTTVNMSSAFPFGFFYGSVSGSSTAIGWYSQAAAALTNTNLSNELISGTGGYSVS